MSVNTAAASNRDDFDIGGGPTFALADLARVSESETHPLAFDRSFGDAALLHRLPPIARLRKALLARGYRFVPEEQTSVAERLAPALQLLSILRKRTIPYRRVGAAVEEILDQAPGARFDDFGFFHVLVGSYTSHEGAHALFYELAAEPRGNPSGERLAEVLLASEGFAIAFDVWLLLQTLGDARRSTKLFFAVNASASPFSLPRFERASPGLLADIAALVARDPEGVLVFLASASLIANLRPDAHAARPQLVEFLAHHARLPAGSQRAATGLAEMAFSLDTDFRKTTAQTFFEHHGLGEAYAQVVARPLETHFGPGAAHHDVLARAVRLVCGPRRGNDAEVVAGDA